VTAGLVIGHPRRIINFRLVAWAGDPPRLA